MLCKYKLSYHQAHITYTDCGMDINIEQWIKESRHTYWKCGVLLMHVIKAHITPKIHSKSSYKTSSLPTSFAVLSLMSLMFMMAVFLHFREQFCDPLPLDVRVEVSCMCQSMCENMQRPQCHTLPVFTSVRSCAYANSIKYVTIIQNVPGKAGIIHCHVLLQNQKEDIYENEVFRTRGRGLFVSGMTKKRLQYF